MTFDGLEVAGLSKRFGTRSLWRDVSFRVPRGQLTAVVGPSGSGKSTLLDCIGLLLQPNSGDIRLGQTQISGLRGSRARLCRRDTLGYLFQNYALVNEATVRENLRLVIRGSRRATEASMTEALESVGLSGLIDEPVVHLSGGEQQRVAVARLLLKAPRLVLADEPTAALDDDNRDQVLRLLRSLGDTGACVLIATHDQTVTQACAEQVDLGACLR